MKLKLFALIVAGIVAVSCNPKKEIEETPKIDRSPYEKFERHLLNDLNQLGDEIRNRRATIDNYEIVESGAIRVFGRDSEGSSAFFKNYRNSLQKSSSINLDEYHPEVLSVIQEIEERIIYCTGSNDFVGYLNKKFDEVYLSDFQVENKQKLLGFISSYKVAIQFIDSNQDILTDSADFSDLKGALKWWNDWGRCAAGILGGAGTGALSFGLAGAAIGTIAVPLVGTVSAGVVGAVGGAIVGGLTGAVSAC